MNAPAGSKPGEGGWVGPALLVALLVASLAAGLLVYRARTPDLALEVTEITRNFERGQEAATFTFFVRFDEPDATVSIVGRNKDEVRTLIDGAELREGVRVACEWNGTGDDGELADVGRYRLRVELPSEDRDMVYPRRIDLVAAGEIETGTPPEEPAEPCEEES